MLRIDAVMMAADVPDDHLVGDLAVLDEPGEAVSHVLDALDLGTDPAITLRGFRARPEPARRRCDFVDELQKPLF